jgi:predicted RNase H-like nuclease
MEWDFLREFRYVDGFLTAADALCERVFASRHDALTMPILFC